MDVGVISRINMSNLDINEIANYLISESKVGITHRELQKLLYFSQGFYLSEHGVQLFNGDIHASIWTRFKPYGYRCLQLGKDFSTESLNDIQKDFLKGILSGFLVLGAVTLIDMSHTDYPWGRNYVAGINNVIEINLIKTYFDEFENQEHYLLVAKSKIEFSRLISKRKDYLMSLSDIGNDWISGHSIEPSEEICKECISFLDTFEKKLFTSQAIPTIPKLLLGPIPSGGVGIEFHFENKGLYLHYHNNLQVEVSIEDDGSFDDYDVSLDGLNEEMDVLLKRIV
jgi:uncharacterized phage-associated protein